MKCCQIFGSGSDIAIGLCKRLKDDGWHVRMVPGRALAVIEAKWDLLLLMHGTLEPIGKFFDTYAPAWRDCIHINAIHPLATLRTAWPYRNPGATVMFVAGPNMTRTSPTYTAYRAGKAILESLIDTLNEEYPDTRFRILRPGPVLTKIHEQTMRAGNMAANYDRVSRIVSGEEKTVTHDEVYEKLKALL